MPTTSEVLAAYHAALSNGRTPEATAAARLADSASHKELNALRAHADNTECFECTAKRPGWAALPHGVFVCIDCAQVHRHMGRHVSQVKAINTGTYLWLPHEIAVMRALGNKRVARAYGNALPKKLEADAPSATRLERALALYGKGPPRYEDGLASRRTTSPNAPQKTPVKPKLAGAAILKHGAAVAFDDLITFSASHSDWDQVAAPQPEPAPPSARLGSGLNLNQTTPPSDYNNKKAAILAAYGRWQMAAAPCSRGDELYLAPLLGVAARPLLPTDFFAQFGL